MKLFIRFAYVYHVFALLIMFIFYFLTMILFKKYLILNKKLYIILYVHKKTQPAYYLINKLYYSIYLRKRKKL